MDAPAAAAPAAAPPTRAERPSLYLAVHTIDNPTAKVPFALILLIDQARRKVDIPHGSKCRMVLPSDGATSVSLWDSDAPAQLQEWLNDAMGGECRSVLHEVQEDFTYGVTLELARMRAAERVGSTTSRAAELVAAGVSGAVGSTQQRLEAWDQRTGVLTTAKETTKEIQQRVLGAMSKAAENDKIQSAIGAVGTGVTSGWAKVSSWVGERMQQMGAGEHADGEYGAYAQPAATHTLGSGGGGGLGHGAPSVDRPLQLSDSMLADPAAAGSPPRQQHGV